MTKEELASTVSEIAGCTKLDGRRMLEAVLEAITRSVADDGYLRLPPLGTFKVQEHKARTVTNPFGKTVDVPAKRVVKFKAHPSFSSALTRVN